MSSKDHAVAAPQQQQEEEDAKDEESSAGTHYDDISGSSRSSSSSSSSLSAGGRPHPELPRGIPRRLSIPMTGGGSDDSDDDGIPVGTRCRAGVVDDDAIMNEDPGGGTARARRRFSAGDRYGPSLRSPLGMGSSSNSDAQQWQMASELSELALSARALGGVDAKGTNKRVSAMSRMSSLGISPASSGHQEDAAPAPPGPQDEDEDELAQMVSTMMSQHATEIGEALAERAVLVESINWLGNHVPGCVLASLSEEIEAILFEEKRKERRKERGEVLNDGRRGGAAAADEDGISSEDEDDDGGGRSDSASDYGNLNAANEEGLVAGVKDGGGFEEAALQGDNAHVSDDDGNYKNAVAETAPLSAVASTGDGKAAIVPLPTPQAASPVLISPAHNRRSEQSLERRALGIGGSASNPDLPRPQEASKYVDPFPYDSDDSRRKREGRLDGNNNGGESVQQQQQQHESKSTFLSSHSSLSHSHSNLSSSGGDNGGGGLRRRPGGVRQQPASSMQRRKKGSMVLPYATRHRSALLFVDISGFTKLSTMLDVESLSKAINSYFQMIVNEVTSHGGDILKFAGDALFAEWQASSPPGDPDVDIAAAGNESRMSESSSLTGKSIESSQGMDLSDCVAVAASCGAKIVKNCSDFPIFTESGVRGSNKVVATLNVHCALGVGLLVGVHVGDNETRREYVIVGDPIEQVAVAERMATHGEIAASPEFIDLLSNTCNLEDNIKSAPPGTPAVIASRSMSYFQRRKNGGGKRRTSSSSRTSSQQPKENIAMQCEWMETNGLKELRKLIALYVHPVVVQDEIAAQNQPGSRGSAQERHRAEAELRSVFTIFIMPLINAKLTGDNKEDNKLFNLLNGIMNVTTRELDRFKGHLRQFIVDDKGVVLIATFGLRGSTFPNMVAERALPAMTIIHNALQTELGVDNQVGATIGNVYCGVVGGVRRHEFAVLGPSVNLAARLMASPDNPGLLVDNNVRLKAGKVYGFNALPPVKAKGYDEPVAIFEPLNPRERRWGKPNRDFVGRKEELRQLMAVSTEMATASDEASEMMFLSGEAGTGKSSTLVQAIALTRKYLALKQKRLIITRNASNEGDTLIPFSMFRSTFLDVLSELQTEDASMSADGCGMSCGGRSMSMYSLGADLDTMSVLSEESGSIKMTSAVERLMFVAKELDAPPEFSEIVGHQLLGLERKKQVGKTSKGNSKAPAAIKNTQAIIDFMARAFIRCTSHVDLVILALDDVHLMDDMSWKVVQAIFEQGRNFLIICASRPIADYSLSIDGEFWDSLSGRCREESRFHEIELQPMSEDDIQNLVAKTLGYETDEIDPKLKREIFLQCGGMPDFASEILQNLKRNGLVEKLANGKIGWSPDKDNKGHDTTTMFSSVGELMIHRIDSLNDAVRKVLHVAAILGQSFELIEVITVMEQLLGIQVKDMSEHVANIRSALDGASQEGILEEVFEGGQDQKEVEDEDDTGFNDSLATIKSVVKMGMAENTLYRFSHDMWRKNILKLLLSSRQRDIHRCIAKALEAQQREEDNDYRSRIKLFSHWKASGDSIKACELALSIGKNFEELGLQVQAARIYEDALDMWRTDEADNDDDVVAGFSTSVLDTVDASDLENMIKIHIALGKVLANQRLGKESVVAYQNALQILQNSPASEELEDRSIVFPIFSGLFVAIKFGDIEQDSECTYEQELVGQFVKETRLDGNPVHYTRALAMQGEMYGRLGKLDEAFEAHNKLKDIYDADKHSAGVCKSYGSDRSAQSFGQSALWHMQQGNVDKALETCRYVIDELMPKMEPRNVHNSAIMLWPITWVMKDNGLALDARANFEKFVVQAFEKHYGDDASTFCLPLYKPTLMLLDLAGNPGEKLERMDEYLLWALNEENFRFASSMNGAMGNLGRDADSVAAEICLLLAKRTKGEIQKKIIKNGIDKACASVERTKPKDGTRGIINAYGQVYHVFDELEQLSKECDIRT